MIEITENQILNAFRAADTETCAQAGQSYRIFRRQVLSLGDGELARQTVCESLNMPTGYRNVGFVETP